MYYALNLFDLADAEAYRTYMRTAGPIVKELGGELVVMGRRTESLPQDFPEATVGGGQRWMVIATYPDADGPKKLWDHPKYQAVKHLRASGTKNYVWAYYEKADILTER